jgi:aspartate racemase
VPRAIGIVGGLGVGATVHYYEKLAVAFATRGERPDLTISHADLGHVLGLIEAKAIDDLAAYMAVHIDRLSKAGARLAAIPAVAPHICAAQLKHRIGVPLIDLIDCVREELADRGAKRLAILGTRFVVESDMYGGLTEYEVVRPDPAAIKFVHANYMRIASTGTIHGADVEGIRRVAQGLVRDRGVDAVVLAGTELSLAFGGADQGFPALDCARVHIDAIAAASMQ